MITIPKDTFHRTTVWNTNALIKRAMLVHNEGLSLVFEVLSIF